MPRPAADSSTVVGIDIEAGNVVWQWTPTGERVDQLVAADGEGVVLVTQPHDGGPRLRRLDMSDGRETATAPLGGADGRAVRPVGGVCRDGNTLLVPVRHVAAAGVGAAVRIELIDGRSLARRRGPLEIVAPATLDSSGVLPEPAAEGAGDVSLAVGGGRIVWAAGGMMGCLGPETSVEVTP